MTDPLYRMVFGGVADADDAEAVRQVERQLHDDLIRDLGHRRRSGVEWRHLTSKDAEAFFAKLELGSEADGLMAFLMANPDGLLVIAGASCDGD